MICPVEVVHRKDDRLLPCKPSEPRFVRAPESGIELGGQALISIVDRDERGEVRKCVGLEAEPFERGAAPDDVLDADPAAESLGRCMAQRLAAVRGAVSLDPGGVLAKLVAEPLEQPRLADARFPFDEHQPSSARAERRGRLRQLGGLERSTDEAGRLAARTVGPGAQEPPGFDRALPSSNGEVSQRCHQEAALELPRGRSADHDRPRLGAALQPRCDVQRVAESDRMAFRRADHADRDLAAVDPDPDVELGQPPVRPHLFRVAVDRLDEAQGCARRAVGIVLRRGREAEEGGDSISHVGVDHAPELLDRPAHAIDTAPDQRDVVLGRESFRERRRADDVGEEHADRTQLVLGFDGRLSRPWDRSVSVTGREHLDPSRADLDRVAGDEERRRCDPLAVHPGSVQRSEVLDLEPIRRHSEDGVCPRHLGVVENQADVVAAPHCQSLRDLDAAPALGAVEHGYERGVGHYPSTLPRRWCQNLHQPNRPGWSLPPSRAIPRKSVWVGCPSLRCVHTMTASVPSK